MTLQLLRGGRASNSIFRQKIGLASRRRASMRQGCRFGSQSWNSGMAPRATLCSLPGRDCNHVCGLWRLQVIRNDSGRAVIRPRLQQDPTFHDCRSAPIVPGNSALDVRQAELPRLLIGVSFVASPVGEGAAESMDGERPIAGQLPDEVASRSRRAAGLPGRRKHSCWGPDPGRL